MNHPASSSSPSRRGFLKTGGLGTLAAAGAPALVQVARAQAPASPNSRLGVGFIGCGSRSGAHMQMLKQLRDSGKQALEFVSVCDIYQPRLERAKERLQAQHACADYRELLARKDVDVVCIATPDHHHGQQAIDALEAGKHVYCEKPVTHWRQFELTKKLAGVAAKSPCAMQVGTQAMSDSAWHQMKKLVKEGLIGQPIFGETGFFRVGDWGERGMKVDDPNAKPGPDLNWEAFLGDSPKRDFSVDRFFRWRMFEDYAGGPVTDLYPHCLNHVVDILGVGFPTQVVAVGGTHRYKDGLREVPDTCSLLALYPENVTISLVGTQANDYVGVTQRGAGHRTPIIRGWDGALSIDPSNRLILFTPLRTPDAKPSQRIPIERGESNPELWNNLLDCARSGRKDTWSPMDLAFRTQTVLQMAAQAARGNGVARFDAAKQVFAV